MDLRQLRRQFSRYFVVGILNFSLSLGLQNFLWWLTGIYSGPAMFLFSAITFSIVVTNSYLWNKHWAFQAEQGGARKYSLFYGLTLLGAVIASGIIFAITTYLPAPYGLSPALWANVAMLLSVGFSILWNFTTYSQIVFRVPIVETGD